MWKIIGIVLFFPFLVGAQSFEMPEGKRFEKIKFKFINNLIIIPAKINGTPLSFILDTGVSKPILFNLSDKDSIDVKNVSEISLKGLGEGESIKALSSVGNRFEIESITNTNQQIYIVLDKELNFSPKLGIPIHGIIGYDFFENFVVEVNYGSKFLKVYHADQYHLNERKYSETLSLQVENKKAYINAAAILGNSKVPIKLLLDTGSSDAVWLFKNEGKGIRIPVSNFGDYLGRGLSGSIYGKRTKIEELILGKYAIKNTKTAFPDHASIKGLSKLSERNGSIGGEVLKKFNWVIDYPNKQISFKSNINYKKPFWFNTSGMGLQHSGVRYVKEQSTSSKRIMKNIGEATSNKVEIRFDNEIVISMVPEIIISDIREDSPAKLAGLEVGDIVLSVNKREAHKFKLQELTHMVDDVPGKKVSILIERRGEKLLFNLRIKKLF